MNSNYEIKCSRDKNLWFGYCNAVCKKTQYYTHLGQQKSHCCNSCWALCSGTIKTTLRMCGKARLTFGNCNVQDYVLAKLNGKEIGRANPYCCNGAKAPTSPYQSKTIVFDFKDGDILELIDTGVSIIVLDALNIISCSTC